MKIRNGFVSNSSSSSFICCKCDNSIEGYDASLEDAEMYSCENGHTFCRSHVLFDVTSLDESFDNDKDNIAELTRFCTENNLSLSKEIINDNESGLTNIVYGNIPSEWCPFCNMTDISQEDAHDYLLKTTTLNDLMKLLRDKYTTYKKFTKAIQ